MGALTPRSCRSEQALIHGDQRLDLEGMREEHVFRDHVSRTEGDYTCHVVGSRRLSELGDHYHVTGRRYMRDVTGPSFISHIGPVNVGYVGKMVECHCQPRQLYEPVSALGVIHQKIHRSWLDINLVGFHADILCTHLHLHGLSTGYRGLVWEGKFADICEGKLKIHLPKHMFKTSVASIQLTPLQLSTGITASTLKFALNSVVM